MNISISGNFRGQTVFFLPGWPDTADVFRDNLMRSMEDTYRLVGLSLPGFTQEMPFVRHYQSRQSEMADETTRLASEQDSSGGGSSSASRWFSRQSDDDQDTPPRSDKKNKKSSGCGLSRRPPQLAKLPRGGYGFEALVDLLALAVDTAMRTHNYAPDVLAHAPEARATPVDGTGGLTRASSESIPSHRLPPRYTRPIFIAHGWGCSLMFELLLRRPHFFSRVIALDVAPSRIDNPRGFFAVASAQKLRELQLADMNGAVMGTAPSSVAAGAGLGPSAAHTPTTAASTPAAHVASPLFPSSYPADEAASAFTGAATMATLASVSAGPPPARPVSEQRAARRRTLASRYAIRTARNRPVAWKQPAHGRVTQLLQVLVMAVFDLFLAVLYVLVPSMIARVVVRVLVTLLGRPDYTYDQRLVVTADTEAVNARLRTAAHQGSAYPSNSADLASPLTTFMLAESLQSGQWQVLLLPFTTPGGDSHAGERDQGDGALSPRVAYQAYYFPPAVRGADDKTSSGGSSGVGTGIGGARSTLSRAAAVRAQAEVMRPLPSMGYLHFRLWLGTALSCLLSYASSAPPVVVVPASPTVANFAGPSSAVASEATPAAPRPEEVKAALEYRHSHSPLISQRYDIPVTLPILYMYGAHKPVMLHSREFCAYVEYCKHAEDGISGVVEIKSGGHWFFADPRFRSEVAEHVWDFCQATASSS